MAIKAIEDSKTLRKYGASLGREGLAIEIIELCKRVAADEGHYKNAITLAGEIQALCQACKYDDYWEEKVLIGFYRRLGIAERYDKSENFKTR